MPDMQTSADPVDDSVRDESIEQFRARVREWCAHHVPQDWRAAQADADEDAEIAFQRQWRETLRSGGFLAPDWPTARSSRGRVFRVAQSAICASRTTWPAC